MLAWLKRMLCAHDWQPYGEPWGMWSPIIGDVKRQRFDCAKCGQYEVRDSGEFMGERFTHRHPRQRLT